MHSPPPKSLQAILDFKTTTTTTIRKRKRSTSPPGSNSSGTGSLRNESPSRLEEAYATSERDKIAAAFIKGKELENQLTEQINEVLDHNNVKQQQQQQQQNAHTPLQVAADGELNLEE